jgi:hypothetical protein
MEGVMSTGAVVRRVPYPVRENHKQCQKCGKLVSRAAYACRRCGKRQRVRPRTILLALSTGLLVGMFAVATAWGLMVPRVVETSYGAGELPRTGPSVPSTAVAVEASDLWRSYNRGASEADRRFKDRPVLVTGTVRSVERDYEGRMMIRFNTGDALEAVNARMALRNDPAALAIVKGRRVSLACVGKGALIGAPLLGDCAVR